MNPTADNFRKTPDNNSNNPIDFVINTLMDVPSTIFNSAKEMIFELPRTIFDIGKNIINIFF